MYGARWPEFFELPKIMIRDITGTYRIEATFDENSFYGDQTILCAHRNCDVHQWKGVSEAEFKLSEHYNPKYLAGLIASKLVSFYYYIVLTGEGVRTGGGFHTYPETVRKFPIPILDIRNKKHQERHDKIVHLVEHMLHLTKRLQSVKSSPDRTVLERQIAATDEEIDHLVYELYGLTKDEIAIVEGASSMGNAS